MPILGRLGDRRYPGFDLKRRFRIMHENRKMKLYFKLLAYIPL